MYYLDSAAEEEHSRHDLQKDRREAPGVNSRAPTKKGAGPKGGNAQVPADLLRAEAHPFGRVKGNTICFFFKGVGGCTHETWQESGFDTCPHWCSRVHCQERKRPGVWCEKPLPFYVFKLRRHAQNESRSEAGAFRF